MHLISRPGEITHQRSDTRGFTLDLAFSNLPEARSRVCPWLGPACDHSPLLGRAILGRRGPAPVENQAHRMKVPTNKDERARLVEHATQLISYIPRPSQDTKGIDECAEALSSCLTDAILNFGRPCRGQGPKRNPWWNEECGTTCAALRRRRQAGLPYEREKHAFRGACRRARREARRKEKDNMRTQVDVHRAVGEDRSSFFSYNTAVDTLSTYFTNLFPLRMSASFNKRLPTTRKPIRSTSSLTTTYMI